MAAILKIKDENGNWIAIPAIQGEKGENGKDYILTEADKIEMVNMVLAALPLWEGGAY